MHPMQRLISSAHVVILAVVLGLGGSGAARAQDDAGLFAPEELEELVGPIALYPDDLVAIVLPAATYPLDVVQAARFLDQRELDPNLAPDEQWDDSIVALLNYPEVLRLMDEDLDWTWDLGEAFLTHQADVFAAIQRFRAQAREAGNLATDDRQVVREAEGAIQIVPADPQVIYVPYYEPSRIVVHRYVPIHYYSRPYPVYYYPYPAGYVFHTGFFWGVTTAFRIGWHSHHLHLHHHLHVGHPYFRYSYYEPFYLRRAVSINIVHVDRNTYVWQPRYRAGARPDRAAVVRTREGALQGSYGTRRYVLRSEDGRTRTVARTSSAQRAVQSVRGNGIEPRGGTTRSASPAERSRLAAGSGGTVPSRASRESDARTRQSALAARGAAPTARAAAPEGAGRPSTGGGRLGAAPSARQHDAAAVRQSGPASTTRQGAAPERSSGQARIGAASPPAEAPRTRSAESRATTPDRSRSSASTAPSRSVATTRSGASTRSAAPSSSAAPTRNAAPTGSAAPTRGTAPTLSIAPTTRSAAPARSAAPTTRSAAPPRSVAPTTRSATPTIRSATPMRSGAPASNSNSASARNAAPAGNAGSSRAAGVARSSPARASGGSRSAIQR
jgi:hypothetical protein